MAKKRSNYTSFRKYLLLEFEDLEIDNKQHLGVLMMNRHFRTFTDKKTGVLEDGYPTKPQLDFAYKVLKGISIQTEIVKYYVKESYRGRNVYRANRETTIKGKKYRKGQFLPKENN